MDRRRPAAVALTVVALGVCYAPTLRGMLHQWTTDEDMGHGFAVPFVILWILWRERDRWRALTPNPSAWGFVLLAAGAAMECSAALGAGLFAAAVGLLVSVAGAVLCLGGFAFVRRSTFLFVLALFMLPKLAIVYHQATLPMQLLASRLAAFLLSMAGVGVIREGNILDIGGRRMLIEEACSGIRYLLPLGFMALLFGYIADEQPWMLAALLATAVPLAIAANAVRVAVSAGVPALSQGPLHSATGLVVFVLCLAALLLARRALRFVRAHYV